MRTAALTALVLVLAGCGGGTTAKKQKPNHQQPQLVARLNGQAAQKAGAKACRQLPNGTLPQNASRADKIAALRAYLQSHHPTDNVGAMLRGCVSELGL
jgi:hypothetical protein